VLLLRKKEDMSHKQNKMPSDTQCSSKNCAMAIKSRGCADGRSQREYTTKAEKCSPTISLEAMIITCTIDAKVGRHVKVTNIPRAFLHTNMNEDVRPHDTRRRIC